MGWHRCACGFYAHTLAGMRRHAPKCEIAAAKLRAAEDRTRIENVERAKKINRIAREDRPMSKHIDHGHEEAIRTIGHGRSSHWPKVEKAFRAVHPQCACCIVKSVKHIQIHHRFPFHYCVALGRQDLELDPRNLITMCEWPGHTSPDHHLLVAHLDDFRSSNLEVAEDAIGFRGMSAAEIRADKRWIAKVAARLTPLDKMTSADKKTFTKRMNTTFPKK